jgi:uncharacterized protein (DUF4415 family)
MVVKLKSKKAARRYGVPDEDTPELTPEMLGRAQSFAEILKERGLKPIGRPRADVTKQPVSLRLDPEIIAHFKAGGEGWQTRINAVLSKHVKAANSAAARKKQA